MKIIKPKDESSSHSARDSDRSSSRHHRDRHRGDDDRDDKSSRHSEDRRHVHHSSSSKSSSRRDVDPGDKRDGQPSGGNSSREDHREEEIDEDGNAEKSAAMTEVTIKEESKSRSSSPGQSASRGVLVGEEALARDEDLETDEVPGGQEDEDEAPEVTLLERCKQEYSGGRYSPELIPFDQIDERAIAFLVPEEDERLLSEMRANLFVRNQITCSLGSGTATSAESAFDKEARKGMSQDEVQFSVEEAIRQDKSVAGWADKYKPRKPRYFNRVHTGFEWNKYNQTHYDVDNPPPKIVQGYKFNLFYPDLIDKSKTPKYTITPCKDNREFGIIRFSAGPPYEDIAFKIVNREWNYSYRSGFRSQFSNGILQLWFHFKRYRYRR